MMPAPGEDDSEYSTAGVNGSVEARGLSEYAAKKTPPCLVRAASLSLGEDRQGRDVVINLEYISDSTTKVLLRLGYLGTLAALGFLIWESTIKLGKPEWWSLQRDTMEVANVVLAALLLSLLLSTGALFFWSVARANRSGKRWTHRRRRLVLLVGAEITTQLVNLVFFLMPNAYLLAVSCSWFTKPIFAGSLVRLSCWNTLVLLWNVQAHSLLPVDGSAGWINWVLGMRWRGRRAAAAAAAGVAEAEEGGEGGTGFMVADLPLWFHLPKVLLLWLPVQFFIFYMNLRNFGVWGANHAVRVPEEICELITSEQAWDSGLVTSVCRVPTVNIVLSSLITGLIMAQMLLYCLLAYVARRKLRRLPYGPYRVSNIELRLQVRIRLMMLGFLTLCSGVLWYLEIDSCSSFILTSLGVTPMLLAISVVNAINGIMYRPIDPTPEQRQLHEVLQDFAWTEAEIPAKLWRRRVADKSLFCFERAIKALYWSWYIYSDERSLETGLHLFGLQRHTLFQERQRDSKCMVAWGGRTIVVAFRGTASLANVAADVKVWRKAHPPQRGSYLLGSRPMVHTGFLQSWQAGGLNQQVLGLLQDIITGAVAGSTAEGVEGEGVADSGSSAERGPGLEAADAAATGGGDCPKGGGGSQANGSGMASLGGAEGPAPQQPHSGGNGWQPPWRIICTGHSLGGALAMLASYDIAGLVAGGLGRGCPADVSVFTFGAPRPGNAAFAADFLRQVPDSWDIFHSNDAVAVEGKFGCLYKRAAHRVILTATRDIIVRPSHIEASMQRGPASSISAHLLRNYARSLHAILRAQFKKGTLSQEQMAALRSVDRGVLRVIANTRPGAAATQELDALSARYSRGSALSRVLSGIAAASTTTPEFAMASYSEGTVSAPADSVTAPADEEAGLKQEDAKCLDASLGPSA